MPSISFNNREGPLRGTAGPRPEGASLSSTDVREVIIIGGGPAGYTAALYSARANLSPLVIEGFAWGGQLMITSDVENYPGYAEGVLGPEMMRDFRRQAERFGAEFVTDDVTRVDFSEHPFRIWVGDDEYRAESVIVSTGATARQLGLPSERTLQGRGVSVLRRLRRGVLRRQARDRRRRRRLGDGGGRLPGQVRRQASRSSTAATISAPRRSCSTAPAATRRSRSSRTSRRRGDRRRQGHGGPAARHARRARRATSRRDGLLRRRRPRPEHGALPRPARPRRGRLPASRSPARPRRTSTASSPSATSSTTSTGRRSPPPARAVWARSTPSAGSRRARATPAARR